MNLKVLIAGGVLFALAATVGIVVINKTRSNSDDVLMVDPDTPPEKLAEVIRKQRGESADDQKDKAPKSLDELVKQCLPSVAVVKGKVGQGTGFMLPQNVLATNAHVVALEFEENIRVQFPSAPKGKQGPFKAKFLFQDKKRDLAFLEVMADIQPLEFAENFSFKPGQEVIAIGSPGLGDGDFLPNSPTKGMMSNVHKIMGQKFYALSISVNPGNSGGPVIDMSGKVLGMITLKARDKDGIAFAIPLEDLVNGYRSEYLAQGRDPTPTMDSWLRACTVFERLIYLGDEYLHGLETYSHAMDAAHARGESPNDGLRLVSRELEGRIKQINAVLADSLESNVQAVRTDQNIRREGRIIIGQMWDCCKEMKSFFDRPRGTLDSYRRKTEELKKRYQDLVAIATKPERPKRVR